MCKWSGGTAGFDNQLIEYDCVGGITMTKSNHILHIATNKAIKICIQCTMICNSVISLVFCGK